MTDPVPSPHEPNSKIWSILEKIILPFTLALLAVYGKCATDRFAEEQVKVAKLQLERQSKESELNLQLKYVELFYHDLQDPDPKKRQSCIALLAAMDPVVAQNIGRAVLANPSITRPDRAQIDNTLNVAMRFGALASYRLVVYFPRSATADANLLHDNLIRLGFTGSVELRQREPTFIDDATKYGYHIRYDDVFEDDAADSLMNILPDCLPGRRFTKVPVVGRKSGDGILTIFLFG